MGKRNGKLYLEDYVSENGENPNGMTNVGAYGKVVGTSPRNLLGRQDYTYGDDRDGPNFGALGADFGLSEKEKERMSGGAMADVPKAPSKKRK